MLDVTSPSVDSNDGDQDPFAARIGGPLHAAATIDTLQVNVGLLCNLACRHCHVASSPRRAGAAENLSGETLERLLDWLARAESIQTVDLTGGSPELNPHYRAFVRGAVALGKRVMTRLNPTVLVDRSAASLRPEVVGSADGESAEHPGPGHPGDWAPAFFAEHRVHVVASLPCYLEENVRKQRGLHAFDDSIAGLRLLNDVGYGHNSALRLTLVYNPVGPSLPPDQASLERDYRAVLRQEYGLEFTELWAMANMQIARWRDDLDRRGQLEDYERLLREAYNPDAVPRVMCRGQVHVDSQGRVHDCDFNYALGLRTPGCEDRYLWDLDPEELAGRTIRTGGHCFGCTAGAGSSCGGTLDDAATGASNA